MISVLLRCGWGTWSTWNTRCYGPAGWHRLARWSWSARWARCYRSARTHWWYRTIRCYGIPWNPGRHRRGRVYWRTRTGGKTGSSGTDRYLVSCKYFTFSSIILSHALWWWIQCDPKKSNFKVLTHRKWYLTALNADLLLKFFTNIVYSRKFAIKGLFKIPSRYKSVATLLCQN